MEALGDWDFLILIKSPFAIFYSLILAIVRHFLKFILELAYQLFISGFYRVAGQVTILIDDNVSHIFFRF